MPCPTRVYKHFTSQEGLGVWLVGSAMERYISIPSHTRQSVDGFFYFHDNYIKERMV